MFPPVDIAVIGASVITAHNNDRSYKAFYKYQDWRCCYTPTREQYFLGIWIAWDTMNPPSPPYFKTKLALLINAIANLLPGSE